MSNTIPYPMLKHWAILGLSLRDKGKKPGGIGCPNLLYRRLHSRRAPELTVTRKWQHQAAPLTCILADRNYISARFE
jgi:hypothetical protein